MSVMNTEVTTQGEARDTEVRAGCAHCGSPTNGAERFCCRGCEFVYRTIHSMGLDGFYRLVDKDTFIRAEQAVPARNYTYLDDPLLLQRITSPIDQQTTSVCFYLPTIHCAACVWLLEKLPHVARGVISARVAFGSGQIQIQYRQESIRLSELAGILNSLGYPPVPATTDDIARENKREERDMLRRVGVAGVCAANTMMLATSLFQSFFTGMEQPYESLFLWASAILATPAVLYAAWPFYRSAIGALVTGTLHIDLPISLAIAGAYVAGLYTVISGENFVYFDSVTALIFLLLLSRYVQRRAVHQARASTLTSWDLFPAVVHSIEAGVSVDKPLREICSGDVLQVFAGERLPADGEILEGSSAVDTSFLTGEPLPQIVATGSHVLAGSVNVESTITMRAAFVGKNCRLGKIIADLETNRVERSALENEVNRLSGIFVFGVLALAVATFSVWQYIDPARAFEVCLSLLIVTCPCAIGLAIPTAVSVALAQAEKHGLFIKRSDALQTLARAEHLYFDKTGTLTLGAPEVKQYFGDSNLLAASSMLARGSLYHPVAQAIERFGRGREGPTAENIRVVPGKGISGRLSNTADSVSLGSYRWFLERQVKFSSECEQQVLNWLEAGSSVSLLERNNSCELAFELNDALQPEALGLVQRLSNDGKKVFILSGDSQAVVDRIADTLQLPRDVAKGDMLPEEKAKLIGDDRKVTAMVGDGLNDAQAMRLSSVGVGVRGGIEATLEVADIFVSQGGLRGFLRLYEGARQTRKVIRRNLCFSAVYNLLGATAAVCGHVNPLFAALLMPASSLTVVVSSMLGKYFIKQDR